MTEPLTIKLQTLTPLWTGGVDGTCDRVHEASIIGSLRWWYEAIVRGLGEPACDSTTDHRCGLDEKRFNRPESDRSTAWRQALLDAYVCDACQAYGATGWARRYRLEVRGGQTIGFTGTLRVTPSGRRRGWFLGPGIHGSLQGTVTTRPMFNLASLVAPLCLASRWGGLAGRTQHGYGVVWAEVSENGQPIVVDQAMLRALPHGVQAGDKGMPSLRNMFFAKVNLQVSSTRWWKNVDGLRHLRHQDEDRLALWMETGSVPVSPAVRNQIRFVLGLGLKDPGEENYVFGSSDRVCRTCYHKVNGGREPYKCPTCGPVHKSETFERTKTKIHISSAYPLGEEHWQVRIWGWVPQNLPRGVTANRATLLQTLHDLLKEKGTWTAALGTGIVSTKLEWHQCASTQDDGISETKDAMTFLRSLLLEEEGK